MGMPGALRKLNLRTAPAQLRALIPQVGSVTEPLARQSLRFWRPLHDKQLGTPAHSGSTDTMQRSLFGLVHLYNKLPQRIVDSPSVKVLQKRLQETLLRLAEQDLPNWQALYSTEWKRFSRTQLDRLF